jgi:hypothetical protein
MCNDSKDDMVKDKTRVEENNDGHPLQRVGT